MVGLYQAAVNRRQHRILRLSFFGFKFISKILNLSRYFVWLLFIDYFRVDLARIKFSKIFSYKKQRLNLNKPDSAIRINPRTIEKP
ncbi:hypothetical protein [uncultured Campylobacter sp.]|mgnify:CR=1 FL=1|uniref:hypothetical protein n=1 Tax=uncultured Campylobacter sp. TaxID=218934 RepID=UPI002602FE7A|nr:hypothetical protein [uncultured Campylobacter sp.]